MANLVILAGLPASGKTTWAKTFFDLKYAIVSSDEIRERLAGSLRAAHEKQLKPWDVFYDEITDRLTHGVDVIADATFLTTKHRDRAHAVALATDSPLHLVLFTNWAVATERNAARDDATRVPDDAMHGMRVLFWDTVDRLTAEEYATVTKIHTFA